MKKLYSYIAIIMLMMVSINFASAQESGVSKTEELATNCIYRDMGKCSDITLKYKTGEVIGKLVNGNSFVPINKSGNVIAYNWSIFGDKNIGNFDITLEKVPYCKFYVKLTAYWIFSTVDRFELVCSETQPSDNDIVSLVKETKLLIEHDAKRTFKRINEGGLKDPYLFVYDKDYVVFAHGYKPELVGTVRQGLTPYLIASVDKVIKNGSGWFTYQYENPETGKEETKIAYQEVVIGSDGKQYIVGTGKYFSGVK